MAFVSRETRQKEAKAMIKDFFKSGSIGLILIFIAFGILIAGNILNKQWQSELTVKAGDVNHLTAQVKQSQMKLSETQTRARNLYTGVDLSRKEKDDEIAKDIFKVATTWSGLTEAKSTWSDVERRYGSQSKNYYRGVFGAKTYRELDWSKVIACAYKGLDSYVVSVKNNVYTYRAIVSFSHITKDGTKTQKSFVSTYTIDSDGKFTGFSYYEVFK